VTDLKKIYDVICECIEFLIPVNYWLVVTLYSFGDYMS